MSAVEDAGKTAPDEPTEGAKGRPEPASGPGGSGEEEVPAPAWARLLLVGAPFVLGLLLLLALRLLAG